MPSPFPGMDPYIEAQADWVGYHNRLIAACDEALSVVLPAHYVAMVESRIQLVDAAGDAGAGYRPDLLVARREAESGPPGGQAAAGVATIEPVTLAVRRRPLEEIRENWLAIRRLPDLELVTVIEVLSPTNKAGPGYHEYLAKRDELFEGGVNFVEIDLLLGGRRLPMEQPLPRGDYYAIVARAERLPMAEVYAWSIRQPLPPIPIPLRPPDADVPIDLGALATTVYDRGRYALTTRYDRPLPAEMPLHPDDRAWAEHRGAEAAR